MDSQQATTARPAVTATDLADIGLTPQQIERLETLASAYPFLEWVDSNEEWRRIVFLKWYYQTGHFDR